MFKDREDAGQRLAPALGETLVVVGLPGGGVPVAFEAAKALNAPLDLTLVVKIGSPGRPELALGAIIDGENLTTVSRSG